MSLKLDINVKMELPVRQKWTFLHTKSEIPLF